MATLEDVARALVAPHKGILAADESGGTIEKRFKSIGVPSTEQNRRDYREMMFRTQGAEEFISGVILYDETIRQKAADGTALTRVLQDRGIIPGIKVDTGAKALAGSPKEKITEGLDGLRERLVEYRGLGAKFAKWRAVITIGDAPQRLLRRHQRHTRSRVRGRASRPASADRRARVRWTPHTTALYEVTERTLQLVVRGAHGRRPRAILLKPTCALGSGAPTPADCARSPSHPTCSGAPCRRRAGSCSSREARETVETAYERAEPPGGSPWERSFSTAARCRRRR